MIKTMGAMTLAQGLHKGARRKFTGLPYITHPAAVAALVQEYVPRASDDMIAAAWLHDAVEDTYATSDEIAFFVGDVVAALVIELTKPNQPKSMDAMLIKACDLIDNLASIAQVAPADIARPYVEKKRNQVFRISAAIAPVNEPLAVMVKQIWRRAARALEIPTL